MRTQTQWRSVGCAALTAVRLRTVLMKVRYDRHRFTDGQLSRQRLKMAFTPDWLPTVISISAYACQCHAYVCVRKLSCMSIGAMLNTGVVQCKQAETQRQGGCVVR